MPYIAPNESREELAQDADAAARTVNSLPRENRAGNLNYLITHILDNVYDLRYADINEAIGMLECCKLELYRRVAAPYEDQKKYENGDAYERLNNPRP